MQFMYKTDTVTVAEGLTPGQRMRKSWGKREMGKAMRACLCIYCMYVRDFATRLYTFQLM